MSNEKIYHSEWSVDDISRYVDSNMTADEIKRFQADLANDPFFKDAVDGFSGHARIHVDHHLQRLDQKFNQKSNRPVVPIWVMSAAASLLLLVVAWFLVGERLVNNASSVFADNTNVDSQQKSKTLNEPVTNEDSRIEFDRAMTSIDSFAATSQVTEQESNNVPPSYNSGAGVVNRPPSARRRAAKKTAGGVVSGIVLDNEGQALIGANVYFPSNEAGITTDFNGKFAVELKSFDSIAIVNYTGFESGVFPIKANKSQQFRLNLSDTDLSQIAVTSLPALESEGDQISADAEVFDESADMSKAKKETGFMEAATANAEPEKGYKKYERYIRRNLNYPAAAKSSNIQGQVKVAFKVLPNGDLFDVRVIQGLGFGCDEEAVRLIKDGPSWAADGQSAVRQGRYTIEFKLK